MEAVKIKNTYWDIAADLYFPPAFDQTKISNHYECTSNW